MTRITYTPRHEEVHEDRRRSWRSDPLARFLVKSDEILVLERAENILEEQASSDAPHWRCAHRSCLLQPLQARRPQPSSPRRRVHRQESAVGFSGSSEMKIQEHADPFMNAVLPWMNLSHRQDHEVETESE